MKEMQECSFVPKISRSPNASQTSKVSRSAATIFESLHDEAKIRGEKREEYVNKMYIQNVTPP